MLTKKYELGRNEQALAEAQRKDLGSRSNRSRRMESLVDCHTHLDDAHFSASSSPSVDELVSSAVTAGIAHIVAVGSSLVSSAATLSLARSSNQQHPGVVKAFAGMHPVHIAATLRKEGEEK